MRIVWILGIVVDAIAIMDIIQSSRDPGGKVLWMLVVLFVPVLGAVLYFALGRSSRA
jgi:Phospholipase_D-nuclease N-terminal